MRLPRSDDELVAAVIAGEDDAFTELYLRHFDRVFTLITRLIGPYPDREDLTQNVFCALHRALPRFRGESSLTTFLHRITTHVAIDHLRSRGRRPPPQGPEALDALMDDTLTPEERLLRLERLHRIFALLDELTPLKRTTFVLVAIEGLSYVQAGEVLAAHPDAVKQRVLQARRELVARLGGKDRRPL